MNPTLQKPGGFNRRNRKKKHRVRIIADTVFFFVADTAKEIGRFRKYISSAVPSVSSVVMIKNANQRFRAIVVLNPHRSLDGVVGHRHTQTARCRHFARRVDDFTRNIVGT